MKHILTFFLISLLTVNLQAQFLKKIKQKAQDAIEKTVDKPDKSKQEEATTATTATTEVTKAGAPDLKVYSKFDFVPGSTILYFDNFEKDNIGETPLGWITSSSAEVVTIDGLEGNWLKMASTSSKHITRNKKQSWGNNFTVEFDLLMVKKVYDPRIDISLISSGGNLVTDEKILDIDKAPILFSAILGKGGTQARAMLYTQDKKLSDNMSANLTYNNTTPVHVSMCVQGKRFRMWWNENKVYDLSAIDEEYLPNQLGFSFGSLGGSEIFVSNIRVAKDVPDTRAKFEEGKIVSNLLFYKGTAKLRLESMGSLLDISKVLKEVTSPVKIVGHTDSDGDDAANQKLSEQRAETIKSILVKEYGIDETKLTIEGRGEKQPIADNKNGEGKAQNRRVEFIFKPEADVYVKPAGIPADKPGPASKTTKPAGDAGNTPGTVAVNAAVVKLQSKILTTSLPYAQFMKTADNRYTFIASKEEGNSKENCFKIELETVNTRLKPETFNFGVVNQKNPLYGTKKFSEIKKTEAVLFYGAGKKPFVSEFSPIIANGHMATFYSVSLEEKLPAVSPLCKLVIEKVQDDKVSGYFVFGNMIEGLKPIKKGDGMEQTFTTGFEGEMKCTFTNVPIY